MKDWVFTTVEITLDGEVIPEGSRGAVVEPAGEEHCVVEFAFKAPELVGGHQFHIEVVPYRDLTSLTLVNGDCFTSPLPGKPALVYADPPFGRGAIRKGKRFSYSDKETGVNYREWLLARLIRVFGIVERGWLCLHHCPELDPHVLVALEDRFGERVGQIAWQDAWVSGFRSKSSRFWPRVHDVLHFWAINDPPFKPTLVDPPTNYKRRGGGGGGPRPIGDVWVGPWSPGHCSFSKEKLGYPDQKPMSLLTRIIEATTDEGDLVLDPFCGSGTTIEASLLLKRSAWGIDQNADAIDLVEQRCFRT